MSKTADKKIGPKLQKRAVLAFLKRVVQRAEKELGMKGMKYKYDDKDAIEGEDCQVYVVGKESLNPPSILEIDVMGRERITVYDYRGCCAEFHKILKEELPGLAKKLKIDDWKIA